MTQKELLYVEDAIGHENNMISIIKDTINNLSSKELINFLKEELKKHESMKKKLLNKLESLANERQIIYGKLFINSKEYNGSICSWHTRKFK